MIVVDGSVVIDVLLRTAAATMIEEQLRAAWGGHCKGTAREGTLSADFDEGWRFGYRDGNQGEVQSLWLSSNAQLTNNASSLGFGGLEVLASCRAGYVDGPTSWRAVGDVLKQSSRVGFLRLGVQPTEDQYCSEPTYMIEGIDGSIFPFTTTTALVQQQQMASLHPAFGGQLRGQSSTRALTHPELPTLRQSR